MNRRNFIQSIIGIIAGIFCAKEKSPPKKPETYSGVDISDTIGRDTSVYVIRWGNDKIHMIYPKEIDIKSLLK